MTRQKRWPEECFKITFNWDEKERKIDFQQFGVEFLFKFNRSMINLGSIKVALASEKNSHGLVKQKWFDGQTETKNTNDIISHLYPDFEIATETVAYR